MMINDIDKKTIGKMDTALQHLSSELGSVRAGKASLALLDKIKVNYYGSLVPINHVATLSLADARTIIIQPWEAAVFKEIEKAIMASEQGITPSNDGKIIRITIPQPTEERRRDLVKLVKKMGEDTKIHVRNLRREGNDDLKNAKTQSDLSEDDYKKFQDEIQKITDRYIKKIDETVGKKESEIMEL